MKKIHLLLLCLLASSAVQAADDPALPKDATLEEKIELTRKYLGCPGASVIVRQHGQTLLSRGFGVGDTQAQTPITAETPFRVGSVAKPFIGTVILQLVEEGKLGLDDPVSRYVEGVPNGPAITVRMLGMNTSGLFNYIAAPEVKKEFAAHPERLWKTDELLALAFARPPHHPTPGKAFFYANTNTLLLAKIVEKITGAPVEDAVKKRLFVPLGLTATRFDETNAVPAGGARGYQFGNAEGPIYWRGAGTVLHDVSNDSPSKWGAAGSLISTAADLSRFNHAITTGTLVSPALWKEQTAWRHCGYPLDYSYGFQLSKYIEGLGHSGQIVGYQACFLRLPSVDAEITVCTNLYSSPNYEEPANWITFVIAEHLTGKPYRYHIE